MSITEKISHAAERKAFETILDSMLKKGQTQDIGDLAQQLIDMIQKIHKDTWKASSFDALRMIAENPDGKWAHYAQRLIQENDPYILKTFLTNAAYEGGFRGYQTAQETSKKYDINVPWLILMDPTSACNMHCTGCWAAEYGHKQSLTYEEMDRVLTEAKKLGTHACLFTGGEPLLRKCVHPLFQCQYPGKELPGVPAAAAIQAVPPGPALQWQPSAPLPHAGKSRRAAEAGGRKRRPLHRSGGAGIRRAPVRKVQSLRRMLEARGRKALGGGALLTTQYTIHTPFQKRPALLSVSDGRVGLSVTAPCDRLYEALAGAPTSPASAAQARTSATDASVSNRVPGRKTASGSSA